MSASVRIDTGLLAAIAKWASSDIESRVHQLMFRGGEVVATSGSHLVRVPFTCCEEIKGAPCFGVRRRDILAAIAAQDVYERDGFYPPTLDHDLNGHIDGDTVLADRPRGNRTITIEHEGPSVRLITGDGSTLLVSSFTDETFVPAKSIDDVMPTQREGSPDGILLQSLYLGALEEISRASRTRHTGLRVTGWNAKHKGAIAFETSSGIRMVLMPLKPDCWEGVR